MFSPSFKKIYNYVSLYALSKQKSVSSCLGKSDEPDGIPAEALKADDTTTTKILHPLFQTICAAKNRSDTVLYENLPCNMTIYHRKRILSFYNTQRVLEDT
jgi:hypothetical protein